MSELNTKSYFSSTNDDDPFADIGKGDPLPPPPELTAPPQVEKPAPVLEVSSDGLGMSVPLDRSSAYRSHSHSRNASSSSIGAMGISSNETFVQNRHILTPSPASGVTQFMPGTQVDPLRQSPSVPNLGLTSPEGFRKTHSRHSSLTGVGFVPPPPSGHTRNASLGNIVSNDLSTMQPPPPPAMATPLSTGQNISGQTRRGRPSYVVPPSLAPEQRSQGLSSPIYTPSPAESPVPGNPALHIESNIQGHFVHTSYIPQPSGVGFYQPLQYHWFYKREVQGKGSWIPFSNKDSSRIEEMYSQGINGNATVDTVPVHGGRYDVHVSKRLCYPVYWDEEPLPVRRCGWFYKPTLESKFYPYDEVLSACLEEEYRVSCVTNQWHRQVDLHNGETVSFHSATTFFQFPSRNAGLYAAPATGDFNNIPSPDYQANSIQPLILKRSAAECHSIPDDESDAVDHLVFLVHGIGSVCDLRFRPVVEVVDSFREISNNLMSTHFGNSVRSGVAHRVEFLPVNWHETLHGDDTGIDKRLKPITLGSIPKLRHFANDTVLDVLFYTSPVYCETIVSTVVHELNRMYELFRQRNPGFTGKVSLGGHSLGTLILFDILSHQPSLKFSGEEKQENVTPSEADALPPEDDQLDDPSVEEVCKKLNMDSLLPVFQKEKLDFKTLLLCGDADFKEMGLTIGQRVQLKIYLRDVHRRRMKKKGTVPHEVHTSSVGYNLTSEGTGQPSVEYPKIEFGPANFFAMGAPIAMFVAVRGIETLGADFKLPTCPKMFNIFHPYDPIAYRIEPLIDASLASLPPVLIPHHKGRKRMHLELRETVTKITGDIKQKLLDGIKNTWTAVQSYTNISRIPAIGTLVSGSETSQSNENLLQISSETVTTTPVVPDAASEGYAEFRGSDDPSIQHIPVGSLNGGRRIDYVLQEAPFESVNEYIFAMASHVGYWQSEDTILLILKEIYADMGIQEDITLATIGPQHGYQPALPVIETQNANHNSQPYFYSQNTPSQAVIPNQTYAAPPIPSPQQQSVSRPEEAMPVIPMGSPMAQPVPVASSQRSRRYVSALQPTQMPALHAPSNGMERTVPPPPVSGFVPLR